MATTLRTVYERTGYLMQKVNDIIAITGTILGIGGMAGAIERGTSPVAAVVCLVVGVACMTISYKKGDKARWNERVILKNR